MNYIFHILLSLLSLNFLFIFGLPIPLDHPCIQLGADCYGQTCCSPYICYEETTCIENFNVTNSSLINLI